MHKVKDLMTTKGLEKIAHEIALGCKANRPRELIIADAVCDFHDVFPALDYETAELMAEAMLVQHIYSTRSKLMDDLSNVPLPDTSRNSRN
jgi:hypothetical protein